jgi:hypothetical protein
MTFFVTNQSVLDLIFLCRGLQAQISELDLELQRAQDLLRKSFLAMRQEDEERGFLPLLVTNPGSGRAFSLTYTEAQGLEIQELQVLPEKPDPQSAVLSSEASATSRS